MTKILLVDDDPLLVRMYQKKLLSDGFEVETAEDGEVAISKFKKFKPDLVLLDVMMPNMDGFEVLKQIKKDKSKVPVIMLTNVGSSEEDVNKGIKLGATAYLVKAENKPKDVVIKVKKVLAQEKDS